MNSATTTLPHAALDQPLPPDVIPGMTWGPLGYRRYPVFSLPWLKKRTRFAVAVMVGYGLLSALAHLGQASWVNALALLGYFVVGGVLMVTAGPALATWVRHRRLPAKAEAWSVVGAVVLGLIAALVSDAWASGGIMRALGESGVEMAPADKAHASAPADQMEDVKNMIFTLGGMFLYFAVSGGLASLAYFSERRRLRARALHLAALESDMRLAVLQAQIEPHFLFNALASIRPLIKQDAAQAEAALDALADHLRATIPQMRSAQGGVGSTLGQQLDICASYLMVMQVRMGSRLQHELTVSPELRAREFPPMMLLSLVENAIKHGIEPKPGQGHLTVRATGTANELRVSVADDGVGLQDGLSSGLGLANIREQLQVRYGGRARLTVAAQPEGGTVAEIMIPLE